MNYFKRCGILKEIPDSDPDIRMVWVPVRYAIHDSVVNFIEDNESITTGFKVIYVSKRRLSDQELRDYNHKFGNIVGVSSPNDI